MAVGILALQGDFERHHDRVTELGTKALYIKSPSELSMVSGLIIPGGESTTLLKLIDNNFKEALRDAISAGMPCFATCAGLILLAADVDNPRQNSLGLINVDVLRNAYGRQNESFVTRQLEWTEQGAARVGETLGSSACEGCFEGVFIRAPKITRVGDNVKVLVELSGTPVCVAQDNVIAMTFHPELSTECLIPHQMFLRQL